MMVYEDEIDLRKYIRALLSHWAWIVGATLLLGVVAAAYSLLQPSIYEATALITVSPQPYQIRFEPSFETATDVMPANSAYPSLALSSEVIQKLLTDLDGQLPEGLDTVEKMRGHLEAESGSDRLLNLSATFDSPQLAADTVNRWALIVVDLFDELYGSENESQVAYFEAQASQALADLDRSEQALIEFQAEDQSAIIENQLELLKRTQVDYLNRQKETRDLLRDIAAFKAQLVEQPADANGSLADDLTHLLLQVRAYNSDSSSALQLQIDQQVLEGTPSRAEQIAVLDDLTLTLQGQLAEWDQLLQALEPDILQRQQQLAELTTRYERLTRARDVNRDLYTTLTRKLEEVLVASEEPAGDMRLASRASVPTQPSGPSRMRNTVIAAFLGFSLSVGVILVLEAWKAGDEETELPEAEPIPVDPAPQRPVFERTG